jgi:tetratricopeptide (TPR) repeat protein
MRGDPQNFLDLGWDYLAAGFTEDAICVLQCSPPHPIVNYLLKGLGVATRDVPLTWEGIWPNRTEEMILLEEVLLSNPEDSVASYLLGNLLYDRRRYEEAMQRWESTIAIDPGNSIAWRNLGIAYQNILGNPIKAIQAYDSAIKACPTDARLIYERDQLQKRNGASPRHRLEDLYQHQELLMERDDLALELCSLFTANDQSERSLAILESKKFAPWEGGEGVALGQHARTHLLLARKATEEGCHSEAVRLLRFALAAPQNLGEARHLLANASDLWVALGDALNQMGHPDLARVEWRRAAEFRGDFQSMSVRTFSEMTYYRAIACRRLGREAEAVELLESLKEYALHMQASPAKIDYFATSLPTMLLFDEDLQQRQRLTALFLLAQAAVGMGDRRGAAEALDEILKCDPNHAGAQDLKGELK